jgi:hypothetical protein
MAYFGFVAFVPLYVVEVLHGSPGVGDSMLTGFSAGRRARHVVGRPDRRPFRPAHRAHHLDRAWRR